MNDTEMMLDIIRSHWSRLISFVLISPRCCFANGHQFQDIDIVTATQLTDGASLNAVRSEPIMTYMDLEKNNSSKSITLNQHDSTAPDRLRQSRHFLHQSVGQVSVRTLCVEQQKFWAHVEIQVTQTNVQTRTLSANLWSASVSNHMQMAGSVNRRLVARQTEQHRAKLWTLSGGWTCSLQLENTSTLSRSFSFDFSRNKMFTAPKAVLTQIWGKGDTTVCVHGCSLCFLADLRYLDGESLSLNCFKLPKLCTRRFGPLFGELALLRKCSCVTLLWFVCSNLCFIMCMERRGLNGTLNLAWKKLRTLNL